jgi:hypothetical protein
MWVLENLDLVFFYVQHGLMDFNSQTRDDIPFTLGIQIPRQLEIMQKFGHGNVVSFDATFGTNQSRARLFLLLYEMTHN